VVTDGGFLVVPSGSGQWTYIRSFDVQTGQEVGSSSIRNACHIALHPSQQAVYTADTDSSPSDIERFTLDPATGAITGGWECVYHGDYPMGGNVFVHRNGPSSSRVVAASTRAPTSRRKDMRYIRTLEERSILGAAFDVKNHAFFAVTGEELCYFSAESLELVSCASTLETSSFVASWMTWFTRLRAHELDDHSDPAEPGHRRGLQHASAAGVHLDSGEPTTVAPVLFDASMSMDEQDSIDKLRFRWDWEGTGLRHGVLLRGDRSHHYNVAGTKSVVLQVKDSLGLVARSGRTSTWLRRPTRAFPARRTTAFELQFAAADVVFDSARGHLYATDARRSVS